MAVSPGHVSLRLCEYVVPLRITRGGRLSPHIGTTLRGGFGKALREISCVHPGETCQGCPLGARCAYG